MGVVFDLIMADDTEVEKIVTFAPFPISDVISTKILDPVTLAKLQAITMRKTFEEIIAHYEVPIFEGDDGPWIYNVLNEFISNLIQLDDTELKRIAHDWTSTEEIQIRHLDGAFVEELVKDIYMLAVRTNFLKRKYF